LKSLCSLVSCVVVFAFGSGCASSGLQRYQSFFQAVELAKGAEPEKTEEALRSACSQNSSAACYVLGNEVPRVGPVPIAQTGTSETATEVVVLMDAAQQAQIFLWNLQNRTLIEARDTKTIELPQRLGKIVQVRFEGLAWGVKYGVQVVGAAGELLDGRELQTVDLSKKKALIAVASCMDDKHALALSMWPELLSHEPEALFLLGDNVYADTGVPAGQMTVEKLWARYAETRRTLPLFFSPKLLPVLATWDDHDFGQNDGDRTFPLRSQAKEVFDAFFGTAEIPGVWDRGPGVSKRWNAFGQRFLFLDNRSFRAPPKEKSSQTHFGVDQEAWLFTELYGETPAWLISGDQFFGKYHKFESYEGNHPESFKRLLKRLKQQSVLALFLSGDRHLAEVMEIERDALGYNSYEITTSSIHASVYPSPWKETPNPRQIEGVASVNNYALLEADATQGMTLWVRVYGPGGKRLISRKLEMRR
jgi:alkaline phosphatase D